MARRALTPLLLLLGAAALAGCRREEGARSFGGARLARPLDAPDAAIEVRSRWRPGSSAPIDAGIAPRFERGFESAAEGELSFSPVSAPAAGETIAPPTLSPDAAASGAGGLRFPAAQGAAIAWVPVHPETRCVLSCAVRRAVAPAQRTGEPEGAAEERALAGRLVVVELERRARPGPLPSRPMPQLDALFGAHVVERHADVGGPPGSFAQQRLEFTTAPETSSLLVILFAGIPGWWREGTADRSPPPEGAVDFDDVRLVELPLARALTARTPPGEDASAPPPWSAWRRDVTVEGELRPALVAAPPTEIRVPLALPDGPFRLRFAYAVAGESRDDWGREPIRFFARLESRGRSLEIPIARPILRPREEVADCGWQECRWDGVGDGGAATLTLATTVESGRPTEDVALFGEPTLVVAAPQPARNVLLISVDTLRADRLGLHGYRRQDGLPTSPELDRLAPECVVFDEARTLAPYTLPAHATLLSGLHPAVHGVETYESVARAGVQPFLAQRFAEAGYATAAFTAGGFLAPAHGLFHGFDRWSTLDPLLPASDSNRRFRPRHGDLAFNEAMWRRCDGAAIRSWLAEHADEPFFLFLHTYLVHNYRPPADLEARFCKGPPQRTFRPIADNDERTPTPAEFADLADRYDATVAAADREIGTLLAELRRLGLLESTVVVILSDHGEELGDHGGFGHGRTLYDEVLRVPLLVRAPGVAPRRDPTPVSLADVAPTLLALAGLEPLPGGCGRRLLPEPDEAVESFAAALDEIHLGRQRALIVGRDKLIEVERMSPIRPPLPVLALFDLAADPAERSSRVRVLPGGALDRAFPSPPEAERLRARLVELAERHAAQRAELGVDVDPMRADNPQLREVGYR